MADEKTSKKAPATIAQSKSGKVWVDFKIDEVNEVAKKFGKPELKADKATGHTFAKFVREKMGIERVGGREGTSAKVAKLPKKKQEELAEKKKSALKKAREEIKKIEQALIDEAGL